LSFVEKKFSVSSPPSGGAPPGIESAWHAAWNMLFPLLFRYRPFYGKHEAGLLDIADTVGPVDMWGDKISLSDQSTH
jgi:hypothetical protein